MTDGNSAVRGDEDISNLFEIIKEQEGRLILSSKFGNNINDEVRDYARGIICSWREYIQLKGLFSNPNKPYASRHIFALEMWLEEKMPYEKMWAHLNNKIYSVIETR